MDVDEGEEGEDGSEDQDEDEEDGDAQGGSASVESKKRSPT